MEKLNLKKFEKTSIEKEALNKIKGGDGTVTGHWQSDGMGGSQYHCTDVCYCN